jgi:pyruvate dehydrogenase E1 component alpha subunit
MRGHSHIDDAAYVPPEQFETWAERDPIETYRERLVELGLWNDAAEAKQEADIQARVEAAIHEAESMPDPEPGDVYTGVFAE